VEVVLLIGADENGTPSGDSRRPKMPPPIFGRRNDKPEKNGAGADKKSGVVKVCSYRLADRRGRR